MNTFYYTASACDCRSNCNYLSCEQRCLALLTQLETTANLKILPKGVGFNTPSHMELRSGDIIILYAGNKDDMDHLLSQRDFFETFRVILIVGNTHLVRFGGHYNLNPRFTTVLGSDMRQLNTVLNRIRGGQHLYDDCSTHRNEEKKHA